MLDFKPIYATRTQAVTYNVSVTVGAVGYVIPSNPKRVALIISNPPGRSTYVYPGSEPTLTTGLIITTANDFMILSRDQIGSAVGGRFRVKDTASATNQYCYTEIISTDDGPLAGP